MAERTACLVDEVLPQIPVRQWVLTLPYVLACPRCGGRLRRIATVEDPAVVGTILAHLGLLHPADAPGPAPPSAALRPAAPAAPSRQ